MALRRVNFVDAVASSIPRIAGSRTATVKVGYIATPPNTNNGVVNVRFTRNVADLGSPCGYAAGYTPVAADRVLVVTQEDMAVVLLKLSA